MKPFRIHIIVFPLLCVGFSVGPTFFLTMDKPRYESINSKFMRPDDRHSEFTTTSGRNGSTKTDEKGHQF